MKRNSFRLVGILVLLFTVLTAFAWVNNARGQTIFDWVLVDTPEAPSPRGAFGMNYDPVRDRIVLYGGTTGGYNTPHSDETWEYDGSSWELIQTPNSAGRRRFPIMVHFPPMGGMILFGGQPLPGPPTEGTWFYDGVDWTKLDVVSPRSRVNHSMAYDANRGVIVLFGGQGHGMTNDTWEFDGTSWIQISPSIPPRPACGPRRNSSMAYDNARKKIVLYGGNDNCVRYNDTWEYDGQVWEKINTPTFPDAQVETAMTYSGSDEVMVLYGGYRLDSGVRYDSQDTWVYNGVTWNKLATESSPPARYSAELAYRSATDTVVLFGGYVGSSDGNPNPLYDETWELTTNTQPVATAGGPYGGDEGEPIVLAGATASDTDGDVISFSWSTDSLLCNFSDAGSLNPIIICQDNGSFTATLTVSDGVNDPVISDATVNVNNVAPSIDNITSPIAPVDVANQPVSVIVEFSDPGVADTHDVTWDWDDSESDIQTSVTSPASQSHTFAEAGAYAVQVTVTDDDWDSDAETYEFVVIYDPDGGFVTGGGWIYSETGWCQLDASCAGAEGKANFGFVSKYKKGASVPTGNTEFNFKAGGLNFHSSSYDWLVVTGSNFAKFNGEGLINNMFASNGAPYKFQLWAGDGTETDGADTFRIKIWYEDSGDVVVYDNGMHQAIGGGNIVVHTGN